jgi:uncharacterized protein (TIGR02246 family)
MKKLSLILTVIASMFFAGTEAKAQSSDKASVEKLIHSYFDALNASSTDKVVSLFTADGVLLAPGAPTASGTEQLKGTFQYVFDNFKYTLEETIGEVIVQGRYAFVRSTSKGSFVIKAGGQTIQDDFRELFVTEKVKGEWKIARYMYNKSK